MNQELERYNTILENLPHAYAYHKIVTDNKGIPVDYIFLEANNAFEKMTGLQRDALIGKRVTEVLPGIEKDDFDWISTYGKVALTGETVHFETYSDQLDRWYVVYAFSDTKGFFAVTFHEVTRQRNEKLALERLIDFGQKNLKSQVGELTYQTYTDELLELSGAKFVAINTYNQSNTETTTRAISGVSSNIRKACQILGFELIGKSWKVIPERLNAIREGRLLHFSNLYDSASGSIAKTIAVLLEKTFKIGDVYVAKIGFESQAIGDLIMFMPRGKTLNYPRVIELYAAQLGSIIMRNRSEEMLRNNEAFLNVVLESIQDGISVLNTDLTIRHTNSVMKNWYAKNLPLEDKHCYECYQNSEQPCFPCPSLRSLESGKTEQDIVKGIPGSPAEWLEVFSYPIKDQATGEVTGIVEFVRDITEQKRAEEKLRESEEKHRRLFETMAQGVVYQDSDGTIISANPAAERILGLTLDQMLGKTSIDPRWKMIREDGSGVPGSEHPAMIALRTGKKVGPVTRGVFRPESETYVWLNITAIPLFKPGEEEPFQAYATFDDITEKRHAEDSLKENEAFIRAVMDNLPIGIAVNTIEPEVNFTYMNDNFARFYRTTREALTGPDAFWNVVYEDPVFRDRIRNRVLADCASGDPDKMRWEDIPITRGGQVVAYISAVNTPIPETELMISTVWDVTNRKQAEEAYQESEERYRKLFEESPVALYEEDFSEVKKDMDSLRDMGINDLSQYFDEHPEILAEWVQKARILKVNQEAKRLFGVNINAQIPPISKHEALGPVSRIFRHEFCELFSGHTKNEYTGQAQDFNGNLIHVFVRLDVVDGHEDKLDRILLSIQDVTEQVRAREELERSYERVQESFLATVRSQPHLVFILNL